MAKSNSLIVPAKWTDDCQGKKDYDGSLVTLSTRYWPRGGGMLVFDSSTGEWQENEDRPEIRPSAHSTIYLGSTSNEFYEMAVKLVDAEFEADTQEEVQRQVETWAASQFKLIADILLKEFHPEVKNGFGEVTTREQETLDALKNLMGFLDTPLARRQYGEDWFYQESISNGRKALAQYEEHNDV